MPTATVVNTMQASTARAWCDWSESNMRKGFVGSPVVEDCPEN